MELFIVCLMTSLAIFAGVLIGSDHNGGCHADPDSFRRPRGMLGVRGRVQAEEFGGMAGGFPGSLPPIPLVLDRGFRGRVDRFLTLTALRLATCFYERFKRWLMKPSLPQSP